MGTVAIVSCCDTKYHEITFVKEELLRLGQTPIVLDISTGPTLPMQGDITREQMLKIGGYSWPQVHAMQKSDAIAAMGKSAAAVVKKLYDEGTIQGAVGIGGLQNTVVCSEAFQSLPLGFPKLIASTVASGTRYFDTVVGNKDIVVIPSIVDFTGMNPISECVLRNAVSAVVGMMEYGGKLIDTVNRFIIGTTLMGITNDTVMDISNRLADMGKEVISFHSTGAGGRTMETLIRDGTIRAVFDMTLQEMTAEYFGGYGYSAGSFGRLCAAAETGIPALVVPGGIDFICLRPDELFEDEEQRGYVWHNAGLTHTRLYEKEILDITDTIIERVNRSVGPVEVVLPMGGLRTMSRPGEFFHIPDTIQKMRRMFESKLNKSVVFKSVDYNFMDAGFAEFVTGEFVRLLGENM